MMNMHKPIKKLNFKDLIVKDHPDYVVVNKPPHLSSLDDRVESTTLLSLAKGENENYQLCHRLDKETSGIIVIAKNPEAYRHFAIQLEKREVKKVYHAVVNGLHKFENFEAQEPIYTTSNKSRIDFKTGKPSFTLVSTMEVLKKHSLIKCFPVTGRMHQIRVHLAFHQAPLVNDPLYGGEAAFLSQLKRNFNHTKWEEEKPMIERVALHSFEIAFKDLEGKVVEAEAPYPKDFSVLIKLLRKFN